MRKFQDYLENVPDREGGRSSQCQTFCFPKTPFESPEKSSKNCHQITNLGLWGRGSGAGGLPFEKNFQIIAIIFVTGFSLDSAAENETLLLILDAYFAQAFVTGHCHHLIRCSVKKCYQAV